MNTTTLNLNNQLKIIEPNIPDTRNFRDREDMGGLPEIATAPVQDPNLFDMALRICFRARPRNRFRRASSIF